MADTKPIEIIIKDERSEEKVQGGGGSNTGVNNSGLKNPQAASNKKSSTAQTVATMVAMRSISYASSNVGKWTGNSRNQAVVDVITRGAGYAAAFAANVYVGIATVAVDIGTSAIDVAYENQWNRIIARQAQARAGGKGGYRR